MRDTLPNKVRNSEFGFVDLDSGLGFGTHWRVYIKYFHKIIYLHSCENLPPPIEIIKNF